MLMTPPGRQERDSLGFWAYEVGSIKAPRDASEIFFFPVSILLDGLEHSFSMFTWVSCSGKVFSIARGWDFPPRCPEQTPYIILLYSL